jgi:hypothetical protein
MNLGVRTAFGSRAFVPRGRKPAAGENPLPLAVTLGIRGSCWGNDP